jgi:uncharacterized protein (TIGR02679 family)
LSAATDNPHAHAHHARLVAVLGGPALGRLRARLRTRLERGAPLSGRMTLEAPSPDERSAIERLFGRISRGRDLQVDLDRLAAILGNAELGLDLAAAVVALEGPVENRASLEAETARGWEAVVAEAEAALGPGSTSTSTSISISTSISPWSGWLENLEQTGLCRRLSGGDPEAGAALLTAAVAVLRRLPAEAIPLAELAAAVAGDSHALDLGAPLSTLVLRAVAVRNGHAHPEDADQRRAAWAAVGVLADELSAPALLLNLGAAPSNPTGRALLLAQEAGEPYRLSTRQLLRTPPDFASATIPGGVVFVCENPSVVAAAANRLGRACRPLLCTEGQPKTALRLLLGRLTAAGARLAYHGDFDWPGLQIANGLVERFGAIPWRMGVRDYEQAPAGAPLAGPAVTPSWDATLGQAMRARGCSVHEEAVLAVLLSDLAHSTLPALLEPGRPPPTSRPEASSCDSEDPPGTPPSSERPPSG